MPQIYVTDETKENIEKISNLEDRTQDGEINFLCKRRIRELENNDTDSDSDNN